VPSPWNDKVLDRFAYHVSWEIRTCTSQLAELVTLFGNAIPAPPDGFAQPGVPMPEAIRRDALLHAGLLHLRSLDDFLRGSERRPGQTPDIQAKDWFVGVQGVKGAAWAAEYWLDPRDRARIDWWLAHLSSLRDSDNPPDWKLADYGLALCQRLEDFFLALDKHPDPARLAAFETAYDPRKDVLDRTPLFAAHAGT
jgi:hypothetical protein